MDISLHIYADVGKPRLHGFDLYSSNITGNLIPMWRAAGIYEALYDMGEHKANEIIPALETGLALMKLDPEKFKKLNSPNGWGVYENAIPFLERLLEACQEYPVAIISVCT